MTSQPPQEPAGKQADAAQPENPEQQAAAADEEAKYAPLVDPRLPTRKDTSLKEFLSKIDEYAPIIPEGVTNYYMTKAGLPPPPQTDPRLAHLLALATQKFVADIAADAYQYSRIRASNSSAANNPMGNLGVAAGIPIPGQAGGAPGMAGAGGAGGKASQGGAAGQALLGIQRPGYGGGGQGGSQNRTVLTMEDLGMAVGEYGVNVKRSEFYR
ncbi:transcription initiation factor IID, TAF10 subunit [Cryphonectria parasitica EP155]|uniref:Transcription initiation factor TFIID subunit 10 n=1 Tax=Cryphonectria parasitica (strain ATCC 38755 / EP155) TaxID=660469 RepID=A0A9P5CQV2_CRYP1|nr:transcription initiation factor IID, TAF10 subunit [Cryphonectria parasitica EP155]KAF3766460.1 transcription initiation factor IID, TAF10 subunit [Cryphonectria parasitica EP155]